MSTSKLIAYNSKVLPIVFAFAAIILVPIGFFAVMDLREYRLLAISFFIVIISILLTCSLYLLSLPRISFEIKNGKMYIYHHRNRETVIPLESITKVILCDDSSSFDARIHYMDGKKGLHRMIRNRKRVYNDFVELMINYNISVEYYSMST